MFGFLFGKGATDNSVTRIEQEGERTNVQNSLDLMVRMRSSQMMHLEDALDDALRKSLAKDQRIMELERERNIPFNLARSIAIDRRAIVSTFKESLGWAEKADPFGARLEVWKKISTRLPSTWIA